MDYRGKVVLVTGASSGIGFDTALAFARRGATVVGTARRAERLQELAARCRESSPESTVIPGDLADLEFARQVVEDTARRFDRLDVLVNNAAIPVHKQIYDVTIEEVERALRINFLSSVSTTLAALPHMLLGGGGTIVNVSSFAAKVAPPRETVYTASKCALDGFTAGLWTDLAGSNIHAALVVPGPIDTEIWSKDDTPSGYNGRKHPTSLVVDAIFDAIEHRRHEVVVPRYSPQLLSARLLRTLAPAALRAGMAWMEPVEPQVLERARQTARDRLGK